MAGIENRAQYEWALKRIESLVDQVTEEMPETDGRKIEYTLLSELVADYSDRAFDLGKPTLQATLKERMFEMGLSQTQLASLLGTSQSRISDIVSGKAHPTYETAREMCSKLDISPTTVLGL